MELVNILLPNWYEYGDWKIATMLENAKEKKNTLQLTLEDFSKKLTISICVICAII